MRNLELNPYLHAIAESALGAPMQPKGNLARTARGREQAAKAGPKRSRCDELLRKF